MKVLKKCYIQDDKIIAIEGGGRVVEEMSPLCSRFWEGNEQVDLMCWS